MDIEIKSRPFTTRQLREIKRDLRSAKMRRFGAIVDHQKLRFSYNALVAWKKNSLRGPIINNLKQKSYISHIYLRKTHKLWPYGLYTMLHARTQKELDSYIHELCVILKNPDPKVLNTIQEFKKTSFNPCI